MLTTAIPDSSLY